MLRSPACSVSFEYNDMTAPSIKDAITILNGRRMHRDLARRPLTLCERMLFDRNNPRSAFTGALSGLSFIAKVAAPQALPWFEGKCLVLRIASEGRGRIIRLQRHVSRWMVLQRGSSSVVCSLTTRPWNGHHVCMDGPGASPETRCYHDT